MMETCKYFLKAESRGHGALQNEVHEVFVDIGSVSVMERTTNGIKVKLSNAGGIYYVKDWHYYTLDDVLIFLRGNDEL